MFTLLRPLVPVWESHEIDALLALNFESTCSTQVPDSAPTPTSSSVSTFTDKRPPPLPEPIANHGGTESPTVVGPSLSERSPGSKPRSENPNKSGNNVCQICGKSVAHLKNHTRIHSGEKPYRCDVCGKAFARADNLTAHLRIHSGEKPFGCPICRKRFSQSSSVTTHLRTHSGERPYRCDFCGKAFADASNLTTHKRIHSSEKPYRCKICNLGFSQSSNLHRHVKTHN